MPNWCSNSLTVTGPPDKLAEFNQRFHGLPANWSAEKDDLPTHRKVCFNALYPPPPEVLATGYSAQWCDSVKGLMALDPNYPVDETGIDGYHWSIRHWGTKWDIYDSDYVNISADYEVTGRLAYGFDTAWSSVAPFVKHIATLFPELTFQLWYWEGGCAFAGDLLAAGGEVVHDWVYDDTEPEYRHIAEDQFGYNFDEDDEDEEDAEDAERQCDRSEHAEG